MNHVVVFMRFWYDFIVGDDWTVAAGVVCALGLTSLVASAGIPAWWLMPLAVLVILAFSLRRATRPSK